MKESGGASVTKKPYSSQASDVKLQIYLQDKRRQTHPKIRQSRQRYQRRGEIANKEKRWPEYHSEILALKNREKMMLSSINNSIVLAYGFIVNPNYRANHNSNTWLKTMLSWFYYDLLCHLAYHNLTSCFTPTNIRSLLSLSFKFCPVPCHTSIFVAESLTRLRKDLIVKTRLLHQ